MHRFFYPHFKTNTLFLHPCFGASLLGSLLGLFMAAAVPLPTWNVCLSGMSLPTVPPPACLLLALAFPAALWATELFPARRALILLFTAAQSFGLCLCLWGCVRTGALALGLRLFWPQAAALILCCHYAMGLYNGTTGRCFSDAAVVGAGCWLWFFIACLLNKFI